MSDNTATDLSPAQAAARLRRLADVNQARFLERTLASCRM